MSAKQQEFIISYLAKNKFTNCLDVEFMTMFSREFAVETTPMRQVGQGAPKVKQAGRVLSAMYKAGKIDRFRVGVSAYDGGRGFPKWIYSYFIPVHTKEQVYHGRKSYR